MNGVEHGHDHQMVNGEGQSQPQDEAGGGGGAAAASGVRGERQPNKTRVTTPYLTKYERARVLGTRALQIRCVFLHVLVNVFSLRSFGPAL